MFLNEETRAKLFAIREALDDLVVKSAENPVNINKNIVAIRKWKPTVYAINDVRLFEDIPYKCVQAHDSTVNTDWTPASQPALWMQYHGTMPETARTWVQPTGAHDIYQVGEYVVWTDGNIYKCILATTYTPVEYTQAWENV